METQTEGKGDEVLILARLGIVVAFSLAEVSWCLVVYRYGLHYLLLR